ncbi:MAG TPA: DUF4352 domain-containing protein [Armatimonadota bacterium]|nr:DUF4352 domain-containing protein [Armatimonadota bacterium]
MKRVIPVSLILLLICVQAGAATFVINGKQVTIPSTVAGGKTYVDPVALCKALGLTITYDTAKKQYVVSTQSQVGAQGTAQMAGDWAEMGKEYSLGKGNPMNFALRSAEFSASRVRIGEEVFFPKGNEKFLVLHYTVHNPQKSEQSASWNTFDFTAVDATNQNREFSQEVGQEANSLPLGSMYLKPAQKVEVYTFIVVPAAGEIPKLIVKRGEGAVLRYDLRGKVKPLAAPFADPSDTTGSTALSEVPVQLGVYCPTGLFDVKVEPASYTSESYADREPKAGSRHLVVNVSFKNQTGEAQYVGWNTFTPKVVTKGGETIAYNENLLNASRDESLRGDVPAGQEIRGRFFFQVRNDDLAAKLLIQEGADRDENRRFAVDLSTIR